MGMEVMPNANVQAASEYRAEERRLVATHMTELLIGAGARGLNNVFSAADAAVKGP